MKKAALVKLAKKFYGESAIVGSFKDCGMRKVFITVERGVCTVQEDHAFGYELEDAYAVLGKRLTDDLAAREAYEAEQPAT